MYPKSEKRFLAINSIAITTLFLLILAGGIVRTSGSGMGCPDWPKCFGQYIPPTSESGLPVNYRERFVEIRVQKNEKFAKLLVGLGFTELAKEIRSDKSILIPEEFNAVKTWIEYINRLLGVLFGLFLIICLIFSFTYLRSRKLIFFLSLLNLFLVGFQGWLGSVVVSTNLLGWVVTVHMLLAMGILAISIYTYYLARIIRERNMLSSRLGGIVKHVAIFTVLLTVLQIALGTTVREQVDSIAIAMNNLNRAEWIERIGINFVLHRDLALLVLLSNGILFFMVRNRFAMNGFQFKYASIVIVLIVIQGIIGFILAYLALPPVAQALHIIVASLLFGSQFYLMLLLNKKKISNRKS